MSAIADVFLKNRADNVPPETLLSEFIVPLFFDRISIFTDRKSVRILGGRGCGKTMFIRYFGHGCALHPSRQSIQDSEISSIGLYLRPDTGFCGLMTEDWLKDKNAKLAFSHYLALNLLMDACRAIDSINQAPFASGSINVGDPILDAAFCSQFSLPSCRVSEFEEQLDLKLVELESWVQNPSNEKAPKFVNFATVLVRFARALAKYDSRLECISFRAFIDEFENIPEHLREVVCDAIKHPDQRLVVHIAHKKHAVIDLKTSSDERILEVHDLSTIDLEEQLAEDGDFELLSAELFLLRAKQAQINFECPLFNPSYLHDAKHLPYRKAPGYREQVLRCVKGILPSPTAIDISREVLNDSALRRRLVTVIEKGLQMQGIKNEDAESLLSDKYPEASVVLGALLNRRSQKGKELIQEYRIALEGPKKEDRFFKVGGWIDNNLYGCLFHLYAGLPRRPNIIYAGFERFRVMASPNLRFFQALCHTALLLKFQRKTGNEIHEDFKVEVETQARAAKQVSDKLFQDILQLGGYGVQLLEVAGRLGRIFEAYNRRAGQSEPEVNHFSIDNADRVNLTPQAEILLREAKIWSVIYEEKDTKNKSDYDIAQADLILNPIYSPHFSISYRKRRKVTLPAAQVEILLCQTTEQYTAVLKQLVDPTEPSGPQNLSLF